MLHIAKDRIHSSNSFLIKASLLFILVLILKPTINAQDSLKQSRVLIENADNWIKEVVDGESLQYLKSNVRIIHDSLYMFCDTALVKESELIAVGEVIIIQDDTINIFSDSLFYNSELKIAKLFFDVVLENENKKLFTESLIYNIEEKKAFFNDTTLLENGTMQLSSLEGFYNVQNETAKFYKEVSIIDEYMSLKTDSLLYDTEKDRAYFLGPTYIYQDGSKIYCEEGYYDTTDKRAYFSGQPILWNEGQEIKGQAIRYTGSDSLLIITGNAEVKDSVSYGEADEIKINTKTDDIELIGKALYKTETQKISGPYIYYNKSSEMLMLNGYSRVDNENGYVEGDTIIYDKVRDWGSVVGHGVWVDTTEGIKLVSDKFFYKEKTSYFKAIAESKRPLFARDVEGDSLFLSADTLLSERIGDSLTYMQAIRDVKVFKKDLQAVCDSLYYSDKDSIFSLFYDPISWSDSTQFLGDTLLIELHDNAVEAIIAKTNAFIATEDTTDYYNQIKGNYVHSFLDSNELQRMLIKGNSESIYFVKNEEKEYVGPNYTSCSHMLFYFEDKELVKINFYKEPDSKMTPMDKVGSAELFLPGFKWNDNLRPLSIESIITRGEKYSESIEVEKPTDSFEEKVKDVIFKTKNKR